MIREQHETILVPLASDTAQSPILAYDSSIIGSNRVGEEGRNISHRDSRP
jgi:hypothetical protein